MKKSEYIVELEKTFKKNIKLLKNVDNEHTKYLIDLKKYNRASEGAFSWQQRILSEMNIYITYLGYLDGLIIEGNGRIEWYKKFKHKEEELKYKNCVSRYLSERKELIKKIKEDTDIYHFDYMNNILETIPSCDTFAFLYNDIRQNQNQLKLQLIFINAYNNGLKMEGRVALENFTKLFEESIVEIGVHRGKNKLKIAKTKTLSKKINV